MNKKAVIVEKGNYLVKEEHEIELKELYELIKQKWTGKIKTIFSAPTTAGINLKVINEDNYDLNYQNCCGGQIWIQNNNDKQTFVITKLTSVMYEESSGRPNLQADCNGVVIDFYFI